MRNRYLHIAAFLLIGSLHDISAEENCQSDAAFLDEVQARTFAWFWDSTNPVNGLVADRAPTPSFSSVAAVGFGLTVWPVGIERGYITRGQGIERVLRTLRFFRDAPQGTAAEGMTGYKGFYYHFIDMEAGERIEGIELSTIDTALLLMGALFCQAYFDGESTEEMEIREIVDLLYNRVEWDWFLVRSPLICMGWTPEHGFIPADYKGYDEAMFLYLLALASEQHAVPEAAWQAFTSTYHWADFYGQEHVGFVPLFGHQYTAVWIDLREIQDAYMRDKGIDYFENSRRATHAQRAYAIANPMGWKDYGEDIWGLTACDGPIDATHEIDGIQRMFFSYRARGAGSAYVSDDGTIAPTAAGGSIAFAPEIVIPALRAMRDRYGDPLYTKHGFVDAFNPTYQVEDSKLLHGQVVPGVGWFDTDHLGIDQGPIILMIENYRTGFIWKTIKRSPVIIRGLRRAGFTGGWLDAD